MSSPTSKPSTWQLPGLLALFLAVCGLLVPPTIGLYLSYVAAAVVIFVLLLLLLDEFEYFAAVSLFLCSYLFLVIGLLVDESGTYMAEIARTGDPNGSAACGILFYTLFLLCSFAGYKRSCSWLSRLRIPALSVRMECSGSAAIVLLVILASVYLWAWYSSPLLLDIERSTWYTNVAPPWAMKVYSAALQSFPLVLGLFFFSRHQVRRAIAGCLVLSYVLAVIFVFGQKMSGLVILAALLMLFHAARGRRLNGRLMLVIVVGVVLSACLIYVQYSYLDRNVAQFAWLRIAMQGQLPWSVFSDPEISLLKPNGPFCVFDCGAGYGINWVLSYRYLPNGLAEAYRNSNTGLTAFYPATIIYMFGLPIALVIQVVASLFVGFVAALLVEMVRRGRLLASLLGYKLYLSLYMIYMMTDPAALQSFWSLIVLVVAIAYFLCSQIPSLITRRLNYRIYVGTKLRGHRAIDLRSLV